MRKSIATLPLIAGLFIGSNLYATPPKEELRTTLQDLKISKADQQKINKKLAAIEKELSLSRASP